MKKERYIVGSEVKHWKKEICPNCEFLLAILQDFGHGAGLQWYDMYYCNGTILLQYGDKGSEYISTDPARLESYGLEDVRNYFFETKYARNDARF